MYIKSCESRSLRHNKSGSTLIYHVTLSGYSPGPSTSNKGSGNARLIKELAGPMAIDKNDLSTEVSSRYGNE